MIRGRKYEGAKETRTYKRAYVTLDEDNLEEDWGLKLTDYDIGDPDILTKYIDVPGRPGMLDATLALNGKVNYTKRTITAEFHVSNTTRRQFAVLMRQLWASYHGIENQLVFSFDSGWYYKGRFEISGEMKSDVSADIKITCKNTFPYKLKAEKVTASIGSSTAVTCTGSAYTGALTINCTVASNTVTFGGTTYTLVKGDNLVPEIHLSSGSNTLTFKGSGTVTITYERGVL